MPAIKLTAYGDRPWPSVRDSAMCDVHRRPSDSLRIPPPEFVGSPTERSNLLNPAMDPIISVGPGPIFYIGVQIFDEQVNHLDPSSSGLIVLSR
jgi:hypothetical protein